MHMSVHTSALGVECSFPPCGEGWDSDGNNRSDHSSSTLSALNIALPSKSTEGSMSSSSGTMSPEPPTSILPRKGGGGSSSRHERPGILEIAPFDRVDRPVGEGADGARRIVGRVVR